MYTSRNARKNHVRGDNVRSPKNDIHGHRGGCDHAPATAQARTAAQEKNRRQDHTAAGQSQDDSCGIQSIDVRFEERRKEQDKQGAPVARNRHPEASLGDVRGQADIVRAVRVDLLPQQIGAGRGQRQVEQQRNQVFYSRWAASQRRRCVGVCGLVSTHHPKALFSGSGQPSNEVQGPPTKPVQVEGV